MSDSKTILLVDDSLFMRTILKNILVPQGYEIIGEADTGRSGIESYKKFKPLLTLMDITMDDGNGIEAIKGIKEFDPSALIVVCSAMGQQLIVLDAIKAGAKDFIVKPFQQDRVSDAVAKVLRGDVS